jgi:hypothetical protein
MSIYLYRRGDGNEGNYPRGMIELKPGECPFAALRALVVNDYIPGRRVRLYIMRNIETDGEPEYGILATVYEGPEGEQAFGAAWLTAELEPLAPEDVLHYEGQRFTVRSLRDSVDRAAWSWFRKGD